MVLVISIYVHCQTLEGKGQLKNRLRLMRRCWFECGFMLSSCYHVIELLSCYFGWGHVIQGGWTVAGWGHVNLEGRTVCWCPVGLQNLSLFLTLYLCLSLCLSFSVFVSLSNPFFQPVCLSYPLSAYISLLHESNYMTGGGWCGNRQEPSHPPLTWRYI